MVLSGNKVIVGKGVGITTDGDLMLLGATPTYDCIKPYDETAPVYKPFYDGNKMMTLFELVKEGESDVRKQAMSTLPGTLTDYAVLFYMESYEQDHDLCSGTDCDNLGLSAVNTPRLLLVGKSDAGKLLKPLTTASAAAAQLPSSRRQPPQAHSSHRQHRQARRRLSDDLQQYPQQAAADAEHTERPATRPADRTVRQQSHRRLDLGLSSTA